MRAARIAGLRYVNDAEPGIRRRRAGRGFTYTAPDGARVTDRETLHRIRSLAIPPAWTDVWISANARGHIQATGRDARGRKQYRYHPRWREVRDETKYHRMLAFGHALPAIRARVDRDLALRGLPRDKVLAAVVRLLEETRMRVGNEEYAVQNDSFGLTTLRTQHVDVEGSTVRFDFRGKSGRQHRLHLRDRRLAAFVRRCQDLPGQHLFQYREDDGDWQPIDSDDVNEYLRETAGEDVTAKDFRTWAGTLVAWRELVGRETPQTQTEGKHEVVQAVRSVAEKLGNTPAVSRRSYIHPDVLDAYLDGSLTAARPLEVVGRARDEGTGDADDPETRGHRPADDASAPRSARAKAGRTASDGRGQEPSGTIEDGLETWLSPDERTLLAFLERRAADVQQASAKARGVA